jgi:hypothetical protein
LTATWLALTFVLAAIAEEIVRAGILAVPKGPREAARSASLSRTQAMLWAILPQAARNVPPDLVADTLEVVKPTSLASVVALPELPYQARQAQSITDNPSPIVAAAAISFILLWPVVRLLSRLEHRAVARKQRRLLRTPGQATCAPAHQCGAPAVARLRAHHAASDTDGISEAGLAGGTGSRETARAETADENRPVLPGHEVAEQGWNEVRVDSRARPDQDGQQHDLSTKRGQVWHAILGPLCPCRDIDEHRAGIVTQKVPRLEGLDLERGRAHHHDQRRRAGEEPGHDPPSDRSPAAGETKHGHRAASGRRPSVA